MIVERYNSEKHQKMLIKWYNQWNLPIETIALLPDLGLIIEDFCCAFIYHLNSKACYFEGLLSEKSLTKQDRKEKLDHLIEAMLQVAKEAGYQDVIFYSNNNSVISRALRTGWHKSKEQYYCLHKDLRG